MIHRIFSWYLTLVVGLTHVGIPVFAHICHGQGEMWFSMLLPSNAPCHKESDCTDTGESCYAGSLPETSVDAKPCCENQTGLLKIESSYCSSLPNQESKGDQTGLIFILPASITHFLGSNLSHTTVLSDHAPPLLIYGRALCIRLQDFRC